MAVRTAFVVAAILDVNEEGELLVAWNPTWIDLSKRGDLIILTHYWDEISEIKVLRGVDHMKVYWKNTWIPRQNLF